MTERTDRLVDELTLEEKVALTAGSDMWHTVAVPRLGVPRLRVSDGPSGVRGTRWNGAPATSLPCGTALASTWDPDLVREAAGLLGREAKARGVRVLLAPTVNLHRSALAGRNFECYSEDPHLTARMAVAYIHGVQAEGVAATVKHFVGNEYEFHRQTFSSEIDERPLRELYLVPFEAAVREAGVRVVMTAYNKLNGTSCAEHRWLLTELLDGEWGFDGFVISDWFGVYSRTATALGGLDLEMPGTGRYLGRRLMRSIEEGEVDEATVDGMVGRMLSVMDGIGALDIDPDSYDEAEALQADGGALSRRVAAQGIVLLRNEGGLLPLDPAPTGPWTVAVIGPNADATHLQGGGSAFVRPPETVSPLQGITERLAGGAARIVHEPGCTAMKSMPTVDPRLLDGGRGVTVEYFGGRTIDSEPLLTETTTFTRWLWAPPDPPGIDTGDFSVRVSSTFTAAVDGAHTFGLVSAGKARLRIDGAEVIDNWDAWVAGDSFFGMGSTEVTAEVPLQAGEPHRLEIEYQSGEGVPMGALQLGCLPPLPPGDLVERAAAAAAAADVAVVVVGLNSDWETEGTDRTTLALAGPQDELVARVVAANPNTVVVVNAGAPVLMPWADRVPGIVQLWYPGQEGGRALADVLFGDVNPSGRLPTTFPQRLEDTPAFLHEADEGERVVYGEGVYVGYRWYDTRSIEPTFCFGHGLSYTTFAYGPADVTEPDADGRRTVTVTVTNTGDRAGKEIVQLYVAPPEGIRRPVQELRAFAAVTLEPGRSAPVQLVLDDRALAYWDVVEHAWATPPGGYELRLGPSSRDVRATLTVEVKDPA